MGSAWLEGRIALSADQIPGLTGGLAELWSIPKSDATSDFEHEQLFFTDFTVSWITARGFGLGFEIFWREESRIPRKIRKKITAKTVADLKQSFLIIVIFYTLCDISSSDSWINSWMNLKTAVALRFKCF